MGTLGDCAPQVSKGPIFIVGMNGSGTTMMLDHLGHHPGLFGFKMDTYVPPHYLLNESRYGNLGLDKSFRELWNAMRSEYPFRRMNKGKPVELPYDWVAVPRNAAGVFDRITREFAWREGKERWCEKTPMYALHIETLARAFPDARYIHMLRDGRDCAVSNHRRWGRHPESSIYRWKGVVDEGRRQGDLLGGQYLEVRYEDLTGDPELHMRRVCNFSGVAFDERVLVAGRPRPQKASQASKTIVRSQDKNAGYLSNSRFWRLERIAGNRLASLGYVTRCPDGDFTPSPLTRLWWLLHDSIKNKLTRQNHMTWSLFFARLKAILRHAQDSTPKLVGQRCNRTVVLMTESVDVRIVR
jgi:hypothetical protein